MKVRLVYKGLNIWGIRIYVNYHQPQFTFSSLPSPKSKLPFTAPFSQPSAASRHYHPVHKSVRLFLFFSFTERAVDWITMMAGGGDSTGAQIRRVVASSGDDVGKGPIGWWFAAATSALFGSRQIDGDSQGHGLHGLGIG
ncbi:hypothetical protein CASFOL_011659 [Castilleja foliolosa]|uniref:Uncharacterized protein n=1 Tax=Castilleja foliolosa TaxID=1961234 RepID=A0ABD3E0B0_9LAMI